ncbi:MAG: peptidoglycan editing factor PgeF [Deltaproteobacteria bacterium]|nr:peptidoglycan editing factor PgeF [Deltaproteobacteria bacterium]
MKETQLSFRYLSSATPPLLTLAGLESFDALAAFSLRADLSTALEEEVAHELELQRRDFAFANQIHGDRVAILDRAPDVPPSVDALIAARPGIFPAVQTADCLPILLLDPVHRVTAAIHAGWKSTVLRITRKVLRLLNGEFGTDSSDLIAFMGPAIGTCCYEVDAAVLEPFRKNAPSASRFIVTHEELKSRHGAVGENDGSSRTLGILSRGLNRKPIPPTRPGNQSFRIDLAGVNHFELVLGGVSEQSIYHSGLCTACYPQLFYSYRRDSGQPGRHIAVAGFRVR